ncbi:MAG: twin-arginine translocase TatA/TatE family subunit [Desulfobacterales bacterium]
MFGIGMPELMLILAIALIVVGPKKLPDLAKSLGRAMNEFKKATSEFKGAMELDYDVKSVKKTFDDVEAEIRKPAGKSGTGLKKKSDAEDGTLKKKDLPDAKEKKADDSSSLPDDADDKDMAATDIPAELLVNADEPASGKGLKEKGFAKNAD